MDKNIGKRRLLNLARLLWEQTDEEHAMTVLELQQALEAQGIQAERKTLYSDLKILQDYGMDIVRTNLGRDCRYFLAGRTFELPELKLLVDAVNASAILTKQQSEQLIEKLSRLTSRPQSVQLRRSLLAPARKTPHTGLYYTIDTIYQALREQTPISFFYYHYGPLRQKVYHQEHRPITCSPYGLIYREERYYLLGHASSRPEQPVCHFRVGQDGGRQAGPGGGVPPQTRRFGSGAVQRRAVFHVQRPAQPGQNPLFRNRFEDPLRPVRPGHPGGVFGGRQLSGLGGGGAGAGVFRLDHGAEPGNAAHRPGRTSEAVSRAGQTFFGALAGFPASTRIDEKNPEPNPVRDRIFIPLFLRRWATSGVLGVEVSGTLGVSGVEVEGSSGVEVEGCSGAEVEGCSGVEVEGSSGVEVVGSSGVEVMGSSGVEVVGSSSYRLVELPVEAVRREV